MTFTLTRCSGRLASETMYRTGAGCEEGWALCALAGNTTWKARKTKADASRVLGENLTLWRTPSADGCPRRLQPTISNVEAAFRRCRQSRRWKEWRPHRPSAFQARPSARCHRRRERCVPAAPAFAIGHQAATSRRSRSGIDSDLKTLATTTSSASARLLRQIILKNIAPQRIRSRLQNHPQPRTRITRPQRRQRAGNRGWVMRKVIDDGDAIHLGANFEAALHALEGLQRGGNLFFRNSASRRQRCRRGRIPHVVFTRQRKLEVGPRFAVAQNRPCRACRIEPQIGNSPGRILARSVSLHWTKRPGQAAFDTLACIEGDNAAAARHQIHQTLERGLDGVEVFVNVGVIELHRGQDDGVGKVVQEFRALVEKRGVVLVAFENEVLTRSQLKAAAEIFRNAADQERRLQRRRCERSRPASRWS